jgi:hypothetical protein
MEGITTLDQLSLDVFSHIASHLELEELARLFATHHRRTRSFLASPNVISSITINKLSGEVAHLLVELKWLKKVSIQTLNANPFLELLMDQPIEDLVIGYTLVNGLGDIGDASEGAYVPTVPMIEWNAGQFVPNIGAMFPNLRRLHIMIPIEKLIVGITGPCEAPSLFCEMENLSDDWEDFEPGSEQDDEADLEYEEMDCYPGMTGDDIKQDSYRETAVLRRKPRFFAGRLGARLETQILASQLSDRSTTMEGVEATPNSSFTPSEVHASSQRLMEVAIELTNPIRQNYHFRECKAPYEALFISLPSNLETLILSDEHAVLSACYATLRTRDFGLLPTGLGHLELHLKRICTSSFITPELLSVEKILQYLPLLRHLTLDIDLGNHQVPGNKPDYEKLRALIEDVNYETRMEMGGLWHQSRQVDGRETFDELDFGLDVAELKRARWVYPEDQEIESIRRRDYPSGYYLETLVIAARKEMIPILPLTRIPPNLTSLEIPLAVPLTIDGLFSGDTFPASTYALISEQHFNDRASSSSLIIPPQVTRLDLSGCNLMAKFSPIRATSWPTSLKSLTEYDWSPAVLDCLSRQHSPFRMKIVCHRHLAPNEPTIEWFSLPTTLTALDLGQKSPRDFIATLHAEECPENPDTPYPNYPIQSQLAKISRPDYTHTAAPSSMAFLKQLRSFSCYQLITTELLLLLRRLPTTCRITAHNIDINGIVLDEEWQSRFKIRPELSNIGQRITFGPHQLLEKLHYDFGGRVTARLTLHDTRILRDLDAVTDFVYLDNQPSYSSTTNVIHREDHRLSFNQGVLPTGAWPTRYTLGSLTLYWILFPKVSWDFRHLVTVDAYCRNVSRIISFNSVPRSLTSLRLHIYTEGLPQSLDLSALPQGLKHLTLNSVYRGTNCLITMQDVHLPFLDTLDILHGEIVPFLLRPEAFPQLSRLRCSLSVRTTDREILSTIQRIGTVELHGSAVYTDVLVHEVFGADPSSPPELEFTSTGLQYADSLQSVSWYSAERAIKIKEELDACYTAERAVETADRPEGVD